MAATPTEKAVKAARTRNLTAAKRSLKLISEIAAQHTGLLEQGAVPEASFMASALKYEQCLTALRMADTALRADGSASGDDGTIAVQREDVALLIQVLRAVVPAPMLPEGGPLATLEAAVADSQPPAGEVPAS